MRRRSAVRMSQIWGQATITVARLTQFTARSVWPGREVESSKGGEEGYGNLHSRRGHRTPSWAETPTVLSGLGGGRLTREWNSTSIRVGMPGSCGQVDPGFWHL